MNNKRTLSQRSTCDERAKKNKKCVSDTYLHKTLKESGIILKHPPEKCVANEEVPLLIRNLKNVIEKHFNYPRNVVDLYENLEKECGDDDIFKHYLFPNIVKLSNDDEEHTLNDSVIKIMLNISILQPKLVDFIFQKAVDFSALRKCGPWIQMILKCFSGLDNIVDGEKFLTNIIDLLDISTEKMVKLQIITAIPDILGDQEQNSITTELSRILVNDHELIPAILDCLSYLSLSDDQYEQLQKKTINMLMTFPKFNYFPVFIKFLLIPGQTNDNAYFEAIIGIRDAIGWPTAITPEISTSQVLTSVAIRNSMIISKVTENSWMKVISKCKMDTDHKPIDFIILLILYTTSEEKQKQVENLIRKQIKLNTLKEPLLNESFHKYMPILKDNLKHLIDLANSLLKSKGDIVVQSFAVHLYTLMLSKLDGCCPTIVAELLQLGLDSKQCLFNILMILNIVAEKDMKLLKCQSIQMLTLLDRMDYMSLTEIRATMNLLCGLAYNNDNSEIRDDINMIIRKELGSSNPIVKVQGILAGVHAVKYLMTDRINCENTTQDISSSNADNLKEAIQIIELISCSTKQFPDMIAFFYDELSGIICAATIINQQFITWLTEAVTNDLQENFIVDVIEKDRIGDLKLSMQYCLNEDSEMDEMIAINIAGLTLNLETEICVQILSPLFELVQILHSKSNDGDLSSIDALLGCPIVMPKIHIDEIDDMEPVSVRNLLDCLIYTINWFRELLNAFSSQTDSELKVKTLKRVEQMEEIESSIADILTKTNIDYKPPLCNFNINKYKKEQMEWKFPKNQNVKQKPQKKSVQDPTVLSGTMKSQATQNNKSYKHKFEMLQNLPSRQLNLNILKLFNIKMAHDDSIQKLTIKSLKYLLNCVNNSIQNVLVSKIKRNTFLSKQDTEIYDQSLAEKYAVSINEIFPKMMEHLEFITTYLDTLITAFESSQNLTDNLFSSDIIDYLMCLEYIFNMLTIYLKWIGFQNSHSDLLKKSLMTFADVEKVVPQNELIDIVAKRFQIYEKYCLQLSTAVSLVELLKSLESYTNRSTVLKILRNISHNFLSLQWKSPDGVLEKGLLFNQSMDILASTYLINSEIIQLKQLTLQLSHDIKSLKGRNDVLPIMKSISKANFSIFYRNLGNALYESTKKSLSRGMTNSEHLGLWQEVANILKYMSEIARTLENRNNLSVFFKKSLPVLKLFLSQGVPVLEIELKSKMEEVIEILKIIQQSTRFLQSLCCHSKLKKDTVLMNKVPYVRQLLEQLIYKVKAALAASNCPQAFWMGNLKNKNIHGEIIASQQSIDCDESVDDCDDELQEDDASDDITDDDLLNPASKSLSDIV